ncbi:MAG TPA: SdpI family protein [Caulobacteraceae bacterium]
MNITRPAILSAALVAASAALGLWAYGHLPDGGRIALHFGLDGQPDGFAPKGRGLATLPVVSAGVLALLCALPRMARQKGLEASAGPYGLMLIGVSAVLLVAQAAVVARAIDPAVDVLRYVFVAVGVLFAVLGNILGKVRHNFIFGIRTPWTLMNETVWDKTHRFTGRLMFVGGIVLVAAAMFGPNHAWILGVLIATAAGPALAGAVYSWIIFPKAKAQ